MFYVICTLIAMLLSSFAIINSNSIGIAFAQNISGVNTFNLTIDDQKYPLMYNITGGEVSSITADRAQSTLLINIASREDGTLTIELPRNVIDSKAQGNTDEEYAVFVDDQPNDFDETTNNNEARVLEIGFDNGAEQIEIAGTQIAAIDATDATATEADNATTITTQGDTTTITTGGPTVITEDNATEATATGGDTPNATGPTTVTASNTFDLTIDDQTYPLMYNITGGEVSSITADRAQSTLLINVASREDGTLTIELPRNVIDSKAQGNTDEEYAVFVDDQPNDFEETTNNNEARVLEIGFDNGAEQIEIAGTQIAAIDATGATATEADNATTITTQGDTTTITTGGPTVITEDNATGATATGGETANATDSRIVTASNTFNLTIDDQKYPLMYNITGGEVSSITADRAQSTLLINVASREDGTLTIELPRNVIDSKAQGNTDEEYAVFVDDQPNDFDETTNNNEARVLEIGFDNGAEQIEIAGTQIAAIDATDATATEADNATTITTEGNTTTITTGGPTVITEDNATEATATGGDTPNATGPTTVTASNTFDLTIDDQTYPLMYNITGGEVSSITADRAQSTLLINIASREDGTLTIELPRNVIDSKAQGNTDEEYAVFVDDQPNDFDETTNNNEARVLEIGFDNGAEQIEIAGTQIAAIDATDATATEADNATTITTEGNTTTITTGGPTVITEDNATEATATGGDTPNATGPTTVTASNTFDLTIDDQTYPLMYNITGGEVSSITADRAQSTLLINIASREDGTLTIELPRNVIDSKAQGNTDEEYAVFVDDQPNDFEETTNNNEARVLEIGFDNGAEQIEIAGTQIIPEFGPISAIILAISIIGFIIAATKYNKLSLIPKH